MRDYYKKYTQEELDVLRNLLWHDKIPLEWVMAWDDKIIHVENEMASIVIELTKKVFYSIETNSSIINTWKNLPEVTDVLVLTYNGFSRCLNGDWDLCKNYNNKHFKDGFGNETDEEWTLFTIEKGNHFDVIRLKNIRKRLEDNYREKILWK